MRSKPDDIAINENALKNIKGLGGKSFSIPSYQRGYKWEPKQVEALLDDIDEFINDDMRGSGEIYCIQPLIVKSEPKDPNKFNVVDGQQRLTTIKLILSALNSSIIYSIEYQTRKGSASFLDKSIKEMEADKEYEKNTDYFHIYKAKEAIDNWFEKKDDDYKSAFLTACEDKVCFIWYEIASYETEENVFRRINEGKIAHTDAELIKGLMLNSSNYAAFSMDRSAISEIHHKIAMEWDQIEYALQDDEFWLFINKEYVEDKEKELPARIEYIFELAAELNNEKVHYEHSETHKAYFYFEKLFKEKKEELLKKKTKDELEGNDKNWVNEIWTDVKSIYQTLDEWYHDPTTFHYVGYLITVSKGVELKELLEVWGQKSKKNKSINKKEFTSKLEERITAHLIKQYEKTSLYDKSDKKLVLNEFKFEQSGKGSLKKQDARDLLLLHNVETVLRQNQYLKENKKYNMPNFTKFDFHLYKREKWEIEHIRPNSDNKFESPEEIELYLRYALISGMDFSKTETQIINDFISTASSGSVSAGDLKDMYEKDIRSIIEEKDGGGGISDEEKDKIWNYTLLDESTNKGYGNYIFPVKRAYLLQKEKGVKIRPSLASKHIKNNSISTLISEAEKKDAIPFVPPCTKYIFTKYYSMRPTSFVAWTKDDATEYLRNMEELLEKFGVRKTVGV